MEQGPSDSALVDLLHVAAELEHCLLASYLFAACSLKTVPEEFAELPGGRENRRRAIQFERTRNWKQMILEVAREEMVHLHYVQCLIRALGERPHLELPRREPNTGNWLFEDWRMRIGRAPASPGTEIPIEPFTPDTARRFVLYESTDALQAQDPFGPESMKLYEELDAFESDARLESVLFDVEDDELREELKQKLAVLYEQLLPTDGVTPKFAAARVAVPRAPEPFQSIADLYNTQILPRYEAAFEAGRVPYSNVDLNFELLNPDYAGEGMLPLGPIHRDKNFDAQSQQHLKDPLRHYQDVAAVVAEIVAEGEGLEDFLDGATRMLAKVKELGGSRAYLRAVRADQTGDAPSTPDWLDHAQRIRGSHLYRFAMAMSELSKERDLARRAGVAFDPVRTPQPAEVHPEIDRLAAELPEQFNVCYLALVAWLSRLYEIQDWDSDRRRRMGIEMLASWPMMSIAVRPFLELGSFVAIDPHRLFRLEDEALPQEAADARELLALWASPERSKDINQQMDDHALAALGDVAAWARARGTAIGPLDIDPVAKRGILARLDGLATLDEFKRQFPYRERGGYSDREPDLEYQFAHPDREQFEESLLAPDPNLPPTPKQREVFKDTLVLRLRFAGRGLVQLATDPDPPTDEAGCTGTHMLHAADAHNWFDRALVWRPDTVQNVILREPRDAMPAIGVRGAEITLMVTDGTATSDYVALSLMHSAGAVQTSGVQQIPQISGLNEVTELTPEEALGAGAQLHFSLLPEDGRMPFLNGYNHLVWQDGEPIDPFILSVAATTGNARQPTELVRRQVFNQGMTLMQMDPLQRLLSNRGPVGFDDARNMPDWAKRMLSPEEQQLIADQAFPISYLKARAALLAKALDSSLRVTNWTREGVDAAISLAERTLRVATPKGTTVGWLMYLLHYGHTLSGAMTESGGFGGILAALEARLGATLTLAPASRDVPNGRWVVTYTKGVMDTDALSDVVYGELFIPLSATPAQELIRFSRTWSFPPGLLDALARYACQFDKPFWADFNVQDDQRTIAIPDGITITETLTGKTADSYSYSATGVPNISDYTGTLAASQTVRAATLTWTTTFTAADTASLIRMLTINAGGAQAMQSRLERHFRPQPVTQVDPSTRAPRE